MLPKFSPSSQQGFTLIELIIVIVILGILAVTAAPRFINVSSDAKIATLEAMGGAMKSASDLVYSKALVEGLEKEVLANVDIDGDGATDIETRFGYPSGSRTNGITFAMGLNFDQEWSWATNFSRSQVYATTASIANQSGFYINQTIIVPTDCYLIYNRAESLGDKPTLQYFTDGC